MNRLSSMVETLPGVARRVLKTTGGNRFHMGIQRHEAQHHLKYEVAAAAVFTAAAVGLLRGRRKGVSFRRRLGGQ